MREIEFRGKPTENNTTYFSKDDFVYGLLLKDDDKYYICLNVNEHIDRDDYEVYMIEVIPETIGQYTGLKDKNGKKIFEGDIVKAFYFETEVIGKIEFIYGTFALTNSAISDNQLFIFEKLEVIGNIWDNPELLKEEL